MKHGYTGIVMLSWALALGCGERPQDVYVDEPVPPAPSSVVNADLWSDEPEILAAMYGFEGLVGIPDSEDGHALVQQAGGPVVEAKCRYGKEPPRRAEVSSPTPSSTASLCGGRVLQQADAIPVVFSFPMRVATLDAEDFAVHLSDGTGPVTPLCATFTPNDEHNERNVALLFGEFGDRGSVHPVRIEVVGDEDGLDLVAADDRLVSAVGLAFPDPPYETPGVIRGLARQGPSSYELEQLLYGSGPQLLAAKLTRYTATSRSGEGVPPNDGQSLYGDDVAYRLRILYSGGFSPNGVKSILPDEYARFFQILIELGLGHVVSLDEARTRYEVEGRTIEILGLADLGSSLVHDDCYVEDHDNFIDIVIKGDEQLVRLISHVVLPSANGHLPVYTAGGPGEDPVPGIEYKGPSRPQVIPVNVELDVHRAVTWIES